ncbi:MAG: diguanylate cyclase, partial [Deltaproteobacteria bacterium]
GGDEFVVVLPETTRAGALEAAERLRLGVSGHRFLTRRKVDLRLTASLGVATFPDDATDVEGLLRGSDAAMYAAKAAGRDGVRAASPGAAGEGDEGP